MIWLQAILNGFFHDFPQAVKQAAEAIVGAAVEIYNRMSAELLPTPAKSHYVFNLRDLSKCVQGKTHKESYRGYLWNYFNFSHRRFKI